MMPDAYIFCPSHVLNKEKIKIYKDSRHIFIAADSGIETAVQFNITPDVLIGDFDSFDLNNVHNNNNNNNNHSKIIKYPAEKNETDFMLAVKYALENGYKNITVIGGIDGRVDHTLANLFYLKYIRNHGGCGYITNGYNKISYFSSLFDSSVRIDKNYKYISVVPVSAEIRGVTLKGFKYPLNGASVKFEEPYTVCNEIADGADYGEIIIKDGDALICECDDM